MKTVKRKNLLSTMVIVIGIIMAMTIPPAKTEAKVNLSSACRSTGDQLDLCVFDYNGEMMRVWGCINGALVWDASCWPFNGNPPDEP